VATAVLSLPFSVMCWPGEPVEPVELDSVIRTAMPSAVTTAAAAQRPAIRGLQTDDMIAIAAHLACTESGYLTGATSSVTRVLLVSPT
jgi:hypothetical protein